MTDYAHDDPYRIMTASLESRSTPAVAQAIRGLIEARDDFYRLVTRPDRNGDVHAESRHAVDTATALKRALGYERTGVFGGGVEELRESTCRVIHDNAYGIAGDLLDVRADGHVRTMTYGSVCGNRNLSFAMSDEDTRVDTSLTDGVVTVIRLAPRQTSDMPLGFIVKTSYPAHVSGAHTRTVLGVPDGIFDCLRHDSWLTDRSPLEQHVIAERCRKDTVGSVDFLNHKNPQMARVARPGCDVYTVTSNGHIYVRDEPVDPAAVRFSDPASYAALRRLVTVDLDKMADRRLADAPNDDIRSFEDAYGLDG